MNQLDLFTIPGGIPRKFYNTCGLDKKEIPAAEKQNGKQNQAVLNFLKANPGKAFTALQVKDAIGLHESSARRACTQLAKAHQITMLKERITERYGKPNHLFIFKQ